MRAVVSFVRASLAAIGAFVAVTASLTIAFTIAISGPPTEEELAGLRAAYADATRALDRAMKQAGAEFCEDLPPEQRRALCDEPDGPVMAEAPPPAAEPAPAPTLAPPAPPPRPAAREDSGLLGGPSRLQSDAPPPRIEPPPPERRAATHRPDRRVRPQRPRHAPTPRRRVPAPPPIHAAATAEERPAPPAPEAPREAVPASLPEAAPDEHSDEDWANNWTPFEEDFYAEPEEDEAKADKPPPER